LLEVLAIRFDLRPNLRHLLSVLSLDDLVLDQETSLALILASIGCAVVAFSVAYALRRGIIAFFFYLCLVRFPGIVDEGFELRLIEER